MVNSQTGFAIVWGNGLIDIIELVIYFMLFDLYMYRVHKFPYLLQCVLNEVLALEGMGDWTEEGWWIEGGEVARKRG
jgi:hypothetical protein